MTESNNIFGKQRKRKSMGKNWTSVSYKSFKLHIHTKHLQSKNQWIHEKHCDYQ